MKMRHLLVVSLMFTAVAYADERVIPPGRLGFPVGTYLVIEGTRSSTLEGARVTAIKSDPLYTLSVDRVNGQKRERPILIEIDKSSLGDRCLPAEGRVIIRGYETGRMVGVPAEAAKVEHILEPQEPWNFHRCFVLTSCVQPKEMPKVKNEARGSKTNENRGDPVWQQPAAGVQQETPRCELSGILHKGEKTIMPYLVLDGSNERCYLRGKELVEFESGARIYVRGVLRSQLFEDGSGPNAPAPFRKGWVVYVDVNQAQRIEEPFGGEDAPQKSVGAAATLQGMQCEIFLDAIPNPLTLHLVGAQPEGLTYSTFMSTEATMPPMPNVRVEATATSSGRVRTCTPVVLTEKRASIVLKQGEAADIQVHHRGFEGLPPGIYQVTVLLFSDTDSKQERPIAVSSSVTVKISSRESGSGSRQRRLGVFLCNQYT